MPIPLAVAALHLWYEYRQENFITGIDWVLFEIQVPREVVKTPKAMELIFSNAFYHKSIKGFWEQYIQGAPWMWFSLEIVSIDGHVHFFIRTPSRIRDLVETQIYAQYPQAKIKEVDDYVFDIPIYKKNGDWNMWACEFTKKRADPEPIKTYTTIEEMKSGTKEEYKVDPITPVIEYMGALPRGQQVWMQILIRQSIKKYRSKQSSHKIDFDVYSREYLEELLAPFTRMHPGEGSRGETTKEIRSPSYIEPSVKEIVKNMQQLHFDCGIRLVSLANKKYNSELDFTNLRKSVRLLFRQYAAPNLNQLERINSTQFDAPWADPTGLALTNMKRRMLDFYRLRTFFHPPFQYSINYPGLIEAFFPSHKPQIFVMSTEELATIYHFPGMVSETPTFKRVESKIAKPPSNLPL